MCSKNRPATLAESGEVMVGTVWTLLDRQSTMMRMALYPLESGSSLIMSMEITCQHLWDFIWNQLPYLLGGEGLCLIACVTSGDKLGNVSGQASVGRKFVCHLTCLQIPLSRIRVSIPAIAILACCLDL